jgi:SulP family sulfate permease
MASWISAVPLARGLAGYRASWLGNDLSAGLAVAAVGIPSALAYPAIAGLPAETGLYACIAPLIAYAIIGSSRQLIVGPDAATMAVIASVLTTIVAVAPEADRVALAGMIAVIVGLLCFLARLLRLGMLANFLSRPILVGLIAGVSLSIIVGQIKRVTGVPIDGDGLIPPILELLGKAGVIHWPSVAFAATMLILLQLAKRFRWSIPGPVLVVVISIALSFLFHFDTLGIATVGSIPTGLPPLQIPWVGGAPITLLLMGSGAVFLISFGSGLVTARSFGAKAGYRVDPDGELLGFSAANIAAGLTGGFPISASDSRTAINLAVGGRSQLVSIVAAATIAVILLYLGPVLGLLPIPSLGAILISAAIGLIDIEEFQNLWRIDRVEFAFAILAAAGPITLGVLQGVIISIAATMAFLLRNLMFPRDALLGRIAGEPGFYKLHRQPLAKPIDGLTIYLLQGSLLFFNSELVEKRLEALTETLAPGSWFVIDAGAMPQVDTTGAMMLEKFAQKLGKQEMSLGFAELHAAARERLERAGVVTEVGESMIFDILDDAVEAFEVWRGARPASYVAMKPATDRA